MRAVSLFCAGLILSGCPQRSIEDTLRAYSTAYDRAFRSLGRLELSEAQTRITGLGGAGEAFQADLDALRRGQGEVSDLLVKAVELKKQALAEKNAAGIDEGTKLLGDAEAMAQGLIVALKELDAKLSAAGAPELKAEERNPSVRD
ncbi:MAG: hypothetical protein IPJ65_14025 [Archangiaceae bacterium]|nr:hypothetical protein [Archangiaceae bacterium]